MRKKIVLKYFISIIFMLLFINLDAQIVSKNSLNTKKTIGYGLEVLGLSIITYSNFNTHYKSLDLREFHDNTTSYSLGLEISELKDLTLEYSIDYSLIEKRNLQNTLIGGALAIGGILLNVLPDEYNTKFRKRQNIAIFFEAVGTGILIGSVINRQKIITESITNFKNEYTYAGTSTEKRLIALRPFESKLIHLQDYRIGIPIGGIILFYGVLTHLTSLRFIENVNIYSMGNSISLTYNF